MNVNLDKPDKGVEDSPTSSLHKKAWGCPFGIRDSFIAIALALFLGFFFCQSFSPIYGKAHSDIMSQDSYFFLYEARAWLAGKTPYRDFYDHKGLFQIAVDMLGLRIADTAGIFILEILAGSLALLFYLETLREIFPKRPELWGVGLALYAFIFDFVGGGNLEGEWLAPWMNAAFYFLYRGFIEGKERDFALAAFFAGLEAGLAFNSRPSDALWAGAAGLGTSSMPSRKRRPGPP